MFTIDMHNNVGRYCSIDATGRNWRVMRAVTGSRYLVKHCNTNEYRTVSHRKMSNLY